MPSYKDANGKWYCQFHYTDWDGARKHTSKHGFTRKKDADEYEREFKAKSKSQVVSMKVLLAAYKENLEALVQLGNLKVQTADGYWDCIERYIIPYFGNVKNIALITPARINAWLANMPSKKYGENGKLRSGTLRNTKSRMNQIMKFAQRNFGLSDNLVAKSESIKNDGVKNRRTPMWTLEQYQLFRDSLPNYPLKVFFDLLFYAGLRISEAVVLTPKTIQPYKLIINATYVRKSRSVEHAHKDRPKTQASVREVQIPHFLYYELQDYISHLYKHTPNESIFPFTPEHARDVMRYRVIQLGLPYASPHTLRHSYASLLLNVTKDVSVVSHQIGHANPKITLSVYSHMIPGEDRAAVDKLEEYVRPINTDITTK